MSELGIFFVGLTILVGTVGVVVPLLPGGLLVVAAVLVWAVVEGDTAAWTTFAIVTGLIAASQVVKFALPGKRLRDAGVPGSTLFVGAALGVVGFFVIPVVGLFLGFVLGVYVAERRRLEHRGDAWPSTKLALKAVGLSVLIELAAVLLAAAAWLVSVVFFV